VSGSPDEREDGGAMARQKSDDCVVPDGHRKGAGSRGVRACGGGKAVAVNQQDGQLRLPFATADLSAACAVGAVGGADGAQAPPATHAALKAKGKDETIRPATREAWLTPRLSSKPSLRRMVEVVNRPMLRGTPVKRSVPKSRM
jgi:hypothetical protein